MEHTPHNINVLVLFCKKGDGNEIYVCTNTSIEYSFKSIFNKVPVRTNLSDGTNQFNIFGVFDSQLFHMKVQVTSKIKISHVFNLFVSITPKLRLIWLFIFTCILSIKTY